MKKSIFIILALALGLSSCDFLDRVPHDRQLVDDYFKTENEIILYSNNFYPNLFTNKSHERQSDIFFSKSNLAVELYGGSKRVVPEKHGTGGWSWGQLRNINTMLGNIDNCDDPAVVKKYTALAKFFRARFYFEKVKRFGDVPWYDKEMTDDDPDLYKPRDSRELVLSHMLEDIDAAIDGLPSSVSTYRVNRWAALMLKAQFCLYEGTYRKYHGEVEYEDEEGNAGLTSEDYLKLAAEASYEILTESPYTLASDYGQMFRQENADAGEYILAYKMDDLLNIRHDATYNATSTMSLFGFSKKFIDSFLMKDGRTFQEAYPETWSTLGFVEEVKGRDPRLGAIIRLPEYKRGTKQGPDIALTSTGFHYDKFVMDENYPQAEKSGGSFNDLPIYRFAEAHLIYAEAQAEREKYDITQGDLDISINKLRSRVGLPAMNLASVVAAGPDPYLNSDEYGYKNLKAFGHRNHAIILEIRRERTIELCLEGSSNYCAGRWDDIVRWKEGACYDQELYGIYIAGPGGYDFTGDGKADYYFYTEKPETEEKDVIYIPIYTDKTTSTNGVYLSEGDKGYIDMYRFDTDITNFNEGRDYHYPISVEDRTLNENLTQTPGWN